MTTVNPLLVCQCAQYGSVGFHNDDRQTMVMIDNKLYELVPSGMTFEQVLSLPAAEMPHVRHLNHIPLRTKEEQKAQNNNSSAVALERAAESRAEKWKAFAKEQAAKKDSKADKAKPTTEAGGEQMAKDGKIKQLIEALQKKALTVEDMVALGVSKSTAATIQYFLKRKGYGMEKSEINGKVAQKIISLPAAK